MNGQADKILTVAILGCGSRGANAYGRLMYSMPDQYKITAICDLEPEKLAKYGDRWGIPKEDRFLSDDEFFAKKRADVMVIATLDDTHVHFALLALKLGYDLLLEKPLADNVKECEQLLEAQKTYGGKILVCHVLRYAPGFVKVKELLDAGAIGKLVSMQALEQVQWWHYAHSYVRGKWHKTPVAAPMILAKCCHDLDMLQHYAGAHCKTISSVGDLTYFVPENKPEGSSDRCVTCPLAETCTFNAVRFYIDRWKQKGGDEDCWPSGVLTNKKLSEETIVEALTDGDYGRCVFSCGNNVVDHQTTLLTFENGITATLTMMAFTHGGGRIMRFFGTEGELVFESGKKLIQVKRFGEPIEEINITNQMWDGGHGHGGGDYGLIAALHDMITGARESETSLEESIESHLMGIRAEESRLAGGQMMYVHPEK